MRQKSFAEKSIKAFRDGILFLLWSRGGKCITYKSPVNGRVTAGVLSAVLWEKVREVSHV